MNEARDTVAADTQPNVAGAGAGAGVASVTGVGADVSTTAAAGAAAAPFSAVGLIAFTRRGCELARRLAAGLAEDGGLAGARFSVCGPARFAEELGVEPCESLGAWTAGAFARCDALVYVGAAGIAVRAIAPHVRDKFSDPAVVSVDEAGAFAVPLLSGHVGGANDLARSIAAVAGGQAVVSTATDVNGRFAVDEWASRQGFLIVERQVAKEVSSRLLDGGIVGFATPYDWDGPLPEGVAAFPSPDRDAAKALPRAATPIAPAVGFAVSLDEKWRPFDRTLHLVPRCVTVGVGCRRGTDPAVLSGAVDDALEAAGVSRRAVAALASIDVKRDEPAIRQLAERRGWRLTFHSAEELAAVPGDFSSSEFVERTVGVDNVCERAACTQGGRLVSGKVSPAPGVTVAMAAGPVRVRF